MCHSSRKPSGPERNVKFSSSWCKMQRHSRLQPSLVLPPLKCLKPTGFLQL